jgi:glycosyltransferase involved in cell wall biosynthesis
LHDPRRLDPFELELQWPHPFRMPFASPADHVRCRLERTRNTGRAMIPSATIKVLMTTDAVGGVWTYSTGLASELAAAGMEVHLVIMGPPPRAEKRAMLRDSRVRVIESPLALEWQDAGGDDLQNARRFLEDLEDVIQPDIIHLNSFREAGFDWLAPVVVVAHSCVNSWGLACDDTEWLSEPKWRHYTRAVAAGLDRAHAWVAPSQAFHDVICDVYRPSSPGQVIWNGISPTMPSAGSKRRFILAAGRMWDAAKNISALARASKGLDWPVFVAGPGFDSRREDSGGLTLIGDLSHPSLRARMQRAAIFASPARYEPFGLSVLEAASAGCALVLSDIPTFRELWSGAALFVDPNSERALRETLAGLCVDDRERTRLQVAARQRSQRYSLARSADAYRALYERLLASRSRSASHHAVEVHG